MIKKKWENLFAFFLSALGTAFLIYYIFRASTDVVSSDYIRLVNYYIKDEESYKYLFTWESISRIPFTFLARFVNVNFFKYSVFFDKILGTFGFFIFNFVNVKFILNTLKTDKIKIIASVIVSIISFSLISWEMILNGTGYPHMITCGLIALVFYLFDRIVKRTKSIMTLENLDSSDLKYYGNEEENNRLSNMVALIDTSETQRKNLRAHALVYLLVVIISLFFAGSYQCTFHCTLIFFSIIEIFAFIIIRDKYNRGEIESLANDKELYGNFKAQYNGQEIRTFGSNKGEKYSTVNNETTFKIFFKFLFLIIICVICLTCFLKSNSTGVILKPVGEKDVTLFEVLASDIYFPIRYMLKAFASIIIGVETFNYAINFQTIDENMVFFVGLTFVVVILITIFILIVGLVNKKSRKENIFDLNTYKNIYPYIFVVFGLANYATVFLARYKFVRDEYGMSSRYAIQYMFLTIGIILIHMIFIDEFIVNKRYYKKDKKASNLSKSYLKRKEKLIAEGKMKLDRPKTSYFFIITIFLSVFCVGFILLGSLTTTMDEIFKADYRKVAYENLTEVAKNYENYSDEELMNLFEYHRSAEHIKDALGTLKNKKLNVFK